MLRRVNGPHPSRQKAFSLVELLTVIVLMVPLLAMMLSLLFFSLRTIEYLREVQLATIRAQSAVHLLLVPLEQGAFGLPTDVNEYKMGFMNAPYAPFNWSGPVSVRDAVLTHGRKRRDGVFRLAYGTSSPANLRYLINVGTTQYSLILTNAADGAEPYNSYKYFPKNWVLFGASKPKNPPLLVIERSGTRIKVRHNSPSVPTIVENDTVHYFRALEVEVLDGVLSTNDFSGSGVQPRIEGIMDARFKWDPANQTMTLFILARGDKILEKKSSLPKEWDTAYSADVPENAFNYTLVARCVKVKIRNYAAD